MAVLDRSLLVAWNFRYNPFNGYFNRLDINGANGIATPMSCNVKHFCIEKHKIPKDTKRVYYYSGEPGYFRDCIIYADGIEILYEVWMDGCWVDYTQGFNIRFHKSLEIKLSQYVYNRICDACLDVNIDYVLLKDYIKDHNRK
jgi:hypothetical protein